MLLGMVYVTACMAYFQLLMEKFANYISQKTVSPTIITVKNLSMIHVQPNTIKNVPLKHMEPNTTPPVKQRIKTPNLRRT